MNNILHSSVTAHSSPSSNNGARKEMFLSVLGSFLQERTTDETVSQLNGGREAKRYARNSIDFNEEKQNSYTSIYNNNNKYKNERIITDITEQIDKFNTTHKELINYMKTIDDRFIDIKYNIEDNTNAIKTILERGITVNSDIVKNNINNLSQSNLSSEDLDELDDSDDDKEINSTSIINENANVSSVISTSTNNSNAINTSNNNNNNHNNNNNNNSTNNGVTAQQEQDKRDEKKKTLSDILEERTRQLREPISRKLWQLIVVSVILYNLAAVPFRIAFMNSYDRLFIWLDLLTYTIYIGDFMFKYQTSRTAQDKTAQEKIMRQLINQNERESIKKQFDSFDKDGNGRITFDELREVMKSIGENPPEDEIKRIIEEVDLNRNGAIEFNEFVEFVEKFRLGKAHKKGFGDIFIKNAVDARSVWFYMDFLCSIPLHLLFGCSLLRFIGLLVPSNILLFLFQFYYSLFPEYSSISHNNLFIDPTDSGNGNIINIRYPEKFSFDGKDSNYDYFSHYNTSIFGLSLETTQFLLFLQLLKFAQLYELVHELEKKTRFIKPTIFRLLHLVILSFLIAHWVGCSWFVMGRIEGYGTNDWVPSLDIVNSNLITQYVRALYWGFVNTTNIESASPTNTVEALFSLFVLFVGVSMYATIIGNVGSLLSNLDSTAVMFREKLDSITAYMHYKEIPPALQARVHDYYEYLWHRQKGLDEAEILRDLPNSMRTDIALYLNRDVLEKVPFFKNASENLISVLVKLLKPQVCAPGEFIIRFGDIGREMYFINRGVVIVCSEDAQTIYNVISDGSFFGEYALLFSQKRSASVQSSTYCDLFVLTQEDFQTVLDDFPEFALAMRKEAVKRVIEKLSFFKDFSKEFRDTLIEFLEPQSFIGGEYIIRKGDIGNEMYFLIKGSAEVCSGDGKTIYKMLKEGDFFGEYALLTSQRRAASVRTQTTCDTFVLSRSDLHMVLKKFPVYRRKMREIKQQVNQMFSQTAQQSTPPQ